MKRMVFARGFTLIELLVVVSIIALIASMLLPALGKAREKAKDSKCAGNLRQTGLSVVMYSDDNDGNLPIHWGSGVNGVVYQQQKSPANRWINVLYGGKTRAGLLWPDYNDGRTFYCPTDTTYFYDRRINTNAGHGLGHYYTSPGVPWTGWNGQYYFSYYFPGIVTPYTSTNRGGAWTGIAPSYWTTQNGPNSYSLFKKTMLQPKLDANVDPMKALLWDRDGLHDFRIANVVFVDGSMNVFREHSDVYYGKVHASWARGMRHKNVMDWLSALY